jgi:hypothetical protein
MSDTFYLHEDEWGMITLLPAENRARTEATAQEAEAFSAAHFDGTSWDEIYMLPEPDHPISERQIPFDALAALAGEGLVPAAAVLSGYSSQREECERCYAFGAAYGGGGALYGYQADGIVMDLHVISPRSTNAAAVTFFGDLLRTLGQQYDLILVDWWQDRIVALRDPAAVAAYLQSEPDTEADEAEEAEQ